MARRRRPPLDDTKWTITGKLDVVSFAQGSNPFGLSIVIYTLTAPLGNNASLKTGYAMRLNVDGTTKWDLRVHHLNNEAGLGTQVLDSVRKDATHIQVQIDDDADFSSPAVDSGSLLVGNFSALRHFGISVNAGGSHDHVCDTDIDDVDIKNGIDEIG